MSSPQPSSLPDPEYLAQYSGGSLVAVAIAFIVLDLAVAVLRFFARRMSKRAWGLDDFFSYAGMIVIFGVCAIALLMPSYAGVGRHLEYIMNFEPDRLEHEYIILYPLPIVYISAFTLSKFSILFLYLRVFNTKTTRVATYVLIGLVSATWISETLSAIFRCTPVPYAWNQTGTGHCINVDAMFAYWSVPNIVTDLFMLTLPLPTIWALHAPRYQKWALTFTFLLGSLGLVAAIVRFSIFTSVGAFNDTTWASVPLTQWTIVEPSMYFIAGVLPTLRVFAGTVWRKLRGSSLGNSSNSGGPRVSRYLDPPAYSSRTRPDKRAQFGSDRLELVMQRPSDSASGNTSTDKEVVGNPQDVKMPRVKNFPSIQNFSRVTGGGPLVADRKEEDYDNGILRTMDVVLTHEEV